MKKSNRFFALCLALTMCATMGMAGALGEAPQPTAEATAPAAATEAPVATTPAAKLPEDILAVVNEKNVLRSDIQPIYDSLASEYSSYGMDLSSMEGYIESIALEYTIQNELWNQKAAENGFDKFSAEEEAEFAAKAQTEWTNIVDQNYTYFLTSTSETPTDQEIADAKAMVEQELANQGYTLDKVAEYYKQSKIQEKIIELLLKDVPALTDEEIQAEYDKRVTQDKESFESSIAAYESASSAGEQGVWYVPEGIRGITHILLKVDSELLNKYLDAKAQLVAQQTQAEALEEEDIDPVPEETSATADPAATASPQPTADPAATPTPVPVTQADVDAAHQAVLDSIKDKTDDIYKRLAAGESFAALVAEYGEDPGMQQEPYKTEGYSVHKDFEGFIQEFTQGAFAAELVKVGDYGQPIVGSYGVHILCYNRDVPSGPKELTEERKGLLLEEMKQARDNEIIEAAIKEWESAAVITYTGIVPKLED